MTDSMKQIVIVGGGTAGWITAGLLAAEYSAANTNQNVAITLIESTEIPPIGVGEGTWPSMRETLLNMGVSETEFLTHCDASFKQGSRFINWGTEKGDQYYHPFSLPNSFHSINLANHWLPYKDEISFDNAVSFQPAICQSALAPKQIATPEYQFIGNYGYHLDAGKFGPFLRAHCVDKLGVTHIDDKVLQVQLDKNQYIESVDTEKHGCIAGDLFIDCTGLHGLLIDKTYQIPFVSCKDKLINDRALAIQVPYASENSPINSATHSTANRHGWIWDIGLQSRRGVGQVYSSQFTSDEEAELALRDYVATTSEIETKDLQVRKLEINPGHREKFWHKNVVAVGMSAGFIEPLEASAIALIEQSAKFITAQLPMNREHMLIVANRFNKKFTQRWHQIIDFLQLHYVLSERSDSEYWQTMTDTSRVSSRLKEKLELWQYQTPYLYDSFETEELFPSASYQYVYYGLKGKTHLKQNKKWLMQHAEAKHLFEQNMNKIRQLHTQLDTNRALLNKIKQYGLQKI